MKTRAGNQKRVAARLEVGLSKHNPAPIIGKSTSKGNCRPRAPLDAAIATAIIKPLVQ